MTKIKRIVLPATKIILSVLWEIGKITTESFFPPQYARKYGYSTALKKRYYFSLRHLNRRGVIEKNKNGIYRLAKHGEKEAFLAHLSTESKMFKPKKQRWDGKWRIIFFDIPEKKRHYRDYLRTILKAVGFKEFQKSTWIYPHPVPNFVKEMLFEENIKHYTRLITTHEIEYDKDLKTMFNL